MGSRHGADKQERRTFQLGYVNEERARPYGAFLNYNTWYDTLFDRYDESFAREAVRLYGEELVRKRGAVLDSILFDDGWDNPETLWEFNEGFNAEFRHITSWRIPTEPARASGSPLGEATAIPSGTAWPPPETALKRTNAALP